MKNFKVISVLMILSLLAAVPAMASLGDNEASVETDRAAFNGKGAVQDNGQYRIHEITASGTTIKEYVSAQGVVFGISWKGRVHPDLKTLLGSYFTEYQNLTAGGPKKGHSPTVINSATLHVEKGGHMRALRGRAFSASLIPAGLTDSVVQ